MPDDDVHHSHDKLFKVGFSDLANAAAMTLAQQYRQEGLEKGLERGRQEDVIEALEIRFGDVPEDLKRAVFAVSGEAELRRFLRAAIQVDSVEKFSEFL